MSVIHYTGLDMEVISFYSVLKAYAKVLHKGFIIIVAVVFWDKDCCEVEQKEDI